MGSKFATYLSHSWRSDDVALNLRIWQMIAPSCSLLVDPKSASGQDPPWYINRIEEYIRRSDLFVGVLAYRDQPNADDGPDGRARCSRHALFEIRLAERARKPRMVVYDARTRFKPGTEASDYVQYVPFDLADVEQGRDKIGRQIASWLGAVEEDLRPRKLNPQQASHILLPSTSVPSDLEDCIERGLRDAEFHPLPIRPMSTEIELLRQLASSGLLVADIGEPSVSDVYAMAHALFLPTIRLVRSIAAPKPPALPWYLAGHPEGYQKDLVSYESVGDSLRTEIQRRATAMRDSRRAIADYEEGCRFLEGKTIVIPHRVLVSHNLKKEHRALVDGVVAGFRAVGIEWWEYQDKNPSGVDWKSELEKELSAATHAVLLVAAEYEASPVCDYELTQLCNRLHPNRIFPFLVGGRDKALVRLNPKHHQTLGADLAAAAAQVVERLQMVLSREHAP